MSADSLTFKDLNACVLYMLCFLSGPLKNSIKSFPLNMGHSHTSETTRAACTTGGLWVGRQNNPVRIALYHGGAPPGFCFSGRIAQGAVSKG